ncbi:putative transposase [Streptacidiphilus sp. MAP12-16]|uniref:IS6 family transposase n=1 Tax=Streptacidiphilus sp. MAP12-16 TaxID=3156300 RepID=UPI003518173A
MEPPSYRGYRYPAEVIGHCVWLYHRFALSLRDVEELMLERGVEVTYETIRQWSITFGSDYARRLRRRRPNPGEDKWHLDEAFIKIQGEHKYLWRAVDQNGMVLDTLVQHKRDKAAASRFFNHKGLNNRAENSHQPTRERERAMKGFRSVGTAQRFLGALSYISPHFRQRRHLLTASDYRQEMKTRFAEWNTVTGVSATG